MDAQTAMMMQNYAAMNMGMQNQFAAMQMVNRMMQLGGGGQPIGP